MADYAITVAVRILNWAGPEARCIIGSHTCAKIVRLYKGGNPAEIIWRPEDLAKFEAIAPRRVTRALTTGAETGLRQGEADRRDLRLVSALRPYGYRGIRRTGSGRYRGFQTR